MRWLPLLLLLLLLPLLPLLLLLFISPLQQLLELLLNAPLGGDDPVMAERLSSLLRALMAHIERASEQSGPATSRDSDGPSTDVQAVLSLGNCLVCLLVSRVQSAELRLAEEALTLAASPLTPLIPECAGPCLARR